MVEDTINIVLKYKINSLNLNLKVSGLILIKNNFNFLLNIKIIFKIFKIICKSGKVI